MLEVLPVQDKTIHESLCIRCGIKYDVDLMAYAAYEDGFPVGICQFAVRSDCGYLVDLANISDRSSSETLLILGRAAMNFIDLCDVPLVQCESKKIDEALLYLIGFAKMPNGIFMMELFHQSK